MFRNRSIVSKSLDTRADMKFGFINALVVPTVKGDVESGRFVLRSMVVRTD